MILQRSTIEGYRNFVNKIWNAHRFLMHHWERLPEPPPLSGIKPGLFDRWILGRLEQTAAETNKHLEARRFNEACKELYAFVWHEYCDWYLEIAKPVLYGDFGADAQAAALATLRHVLEASLRLLHPFMPFVTEELWQRLPGMSDSIMVSEYPKGDSSRVDEEVLWRVRRYIDVVEKQRGLRGENLIRPKEKVETTVVTTDDQLRAVILQEPDIFRSLTATVAIALPAAHEIDAWLAKLKGQPTTVGDGFQVFIKAETAVDARAERERLTKDIEKAQAQIVKIRAKLDKPDFVSKAPPEVVEKNREELLTLETQISKLNETLSHL
jgi:valyl-tRNA synthetase